MPRRPRPGDRERIEHALTPSLRRALTEQCELLGIRRDGWQFTPLGPVYTQSAVILEAAVIWQLRDGMSWRNAIEASAIRLGIPPATIRNRTERWTRASVYQSHYRGLADDNDVRCSAGNADQEAA
ncbi:MAG: hypothetical protein ACREM1_06655 [Longimicrobiales bacterium]